ncbi:hypothetical protein D9M71_339690 [compost metagenome]
MAEHQEEQGHANQPQGRGEEHHGRARETLELQHQQGQHDHDEQRHAGVHRALPTGGVFHRTADFQQVAVRQLGADRLQRRQDVLDQAGRQRLVVDVATHGDGGQAVAVPDDALLEPVFQGGDLRQRHAATVVRGHRQARQQGQILAFTHGAAQEDLDQLIVFAVLAHRRTRQRALQESRQVGGAHPHRPGAVLVDVQPHHLARLLPVQVHVHHMRVFAHLVGHLAGQGADFVDVFAGYAELHRVTHRRAILQARDTAAQGGEFIVQHLDQPAADFLAGLDGLGQHHELGEARRRQLLVQRQVETWRAGADVGDVVIHTRVVAQQLLQALHLGLGIGQ